MLKTLFRRFARRARHDMLYLVTLPLHGLALALPRRLGLAVFGALGRLVFAVGGRERRRTIAHLRMIYGGEWSEKRILTVARQVFVGLGKNLFDAVRFPRLGDQEWERIVAHDSLEGMQAASRDGHGLVGVTGHIGCFEMLLPFCARNNISSFAIGQRLVDSRVDRLVARERAAGNTIYLRRTDNPRKIVRLLQEGRTLGVLIDQDTNVKGVFAYFLGRPAYTPCGPVRLAMRMRIPLFVVTTARQADNRHYVYLNGPLELADTGDFDADLLANVQKVNDILSNAIRRNPEQWVWMHRRWRRQPTDRGMENVPGAGTAPRG